MESLDHERFMRRAIALTANCPALPFGAAIVCAETGEVVAEGWNKSAINPTWHGEIDAINRLAESGRGDSGSGLVLYTTAEPCPMCLAAILWSGIGTVVFGSSIRFLQQQGWRQIDIFAEEVGRRSPGWACTIIGGVLEQECNALFEGRAAADRVDSDRRVPDDIAGEANPDRGRDENIDTTIGRLLDGQLYGVLCTQGQGQPYGSLVAFAMTPGLDSAVFATQKATRKYRLLSGSAHVALVVDNRSALPGRLMDVEAVTATGRALEVVSRPDFEQWSRLLTDRHPYLDTFVRSVSCGLFRIDIGRYLHVTRFQEVRQWVPERRAYTW